MVGASHGMSCTRDQASGRSLPALLVAIVALVLSLLVTAPATAEVRPFEIQEYQEDFDVPAAIAKERLEIQRRGVDVVAQVEENLGQEYAGVWFDQNNGEFVVPLVRNASRATVQGEMAAARLENDFRTVMVETTWDELESAQEKLNQELTELLEAKLVTTSLDPRTNAIVVHQARRTSEAQQEEIEHLAEAQSVKVEVREEDTAFFEYETMACESQNSSCGRPLRGGVKILDAELEPAFYLCSSAFRARGDTDGKKYLLTAGHCQEELAWAARDEFLTKRLLGYMTGWAFGSKGDWAKIDVTGSWWDVSPWPAEVAYWGVNEDYPIHGEASSFMSQTVCHAGWRTGSDCGTVVGLNQTIDYGPLGIVQHLTKASPLCIASGDSGGSVFAANQALGIVSGSSTHPECEREMLYSEITDATNDLDAHIAYDSDVTAAATPLNGNPGWVQVSGTAKSGGNSIGTGQVTINLSKLEGGNWVFKDSAQASISNGSYQTGHIVVGKGTWRAKAVLPPMEWIEPSESPYSEFTIKDGYQLVAQHSGKCLDVYAANPANGTAITQYECLNPVSSPNQVFTLVPEGGSNYRIVARHSNRCVSVTAAGQSNGTLLEQYDCAGPGQPGQSWKGIPVTGEYVNFRANHSGKCMDVLGWSQANGASVGQWDCGPAYGNQLWKFKSVESGQIPTKTYLTVDRALNGQPGLATVSGSVDSAGYSVNGEKVNVNFSKWENGQWVYKDTIQPTLNSAGSYSWIDWGVGVGWWRVTTVYPGNGALGTSQSVYREFEIKKASRLIAKHSNKCMSLSGNNGSNGTALIQWTCSPTPTPGDGQVFDFDPQGGGYYRIKIVSTGKCLDVAGASTGDGAAIHQWDCGPGYNQQWQVVGISGQSGWYALIARHSGKCADVYGALTVNGTLIHQWSCNWGGNQQWAIQGVN